MLAYYTGQNYPYGRGRQPGYVPPGGILRQRYRAKQPGSAQ